METITSIDTLSGFVLDTDKPYQTYEGFQIVTTEQTILFLIDDQQNCCESFGYLTTNDETGFFIGSALQGVSLVDTQYDVTNYSGSGDSDDGEAVIFVNIATSVGVLQLVAYNAHNGYYGHAVRIRSRQVSADHSI